MGRRRILYISDSLGTPVPQRGIFNFSVALIGKLKDAGAEVTLLVERPNGNGIREHWFERDLFVEKSLYSWQNLEVYRYLNSGLFEFSLELNEHVDFAARDAAHCSVLRYLSDQSVNHLETLMRNIDSDLFLVPGDPIESEAKRLKKAVRIDYIANYYDNLSRPYFSEATDVPRELITELNSYLKLFNGFLTVNSFYSNSLTRAHNFIPPYGVDCGAFDDVVVDGPHYLSLVNNNPDRTFQILYDLIPLKNASLSEESHRSFSQKLFASLDLDANAVFISKAAQKEFHAVFPERMFRSERVIYPPVRDILVHRDEQRLEAKKYISKTVPLERVTVSSKTHVLSQVSRKMPSFILSLFPNRKIRRWDSRKPYFVTVLSDEPYKNAALCVAAFLKLEKQANLLIIGRMDPSKYLTDPVPSNIHFTGFLADVLKNELIADSAGLIFPSLFEGFGLPVLEGAMQGVPVLCSSIDVFREIVGNHASYFDPRNAEELVDCVLGVLSDPAVAKERAVAARDFVRERFMQDATSVGI